MDCAGVEDLWLVIEKVLRPSHLQAAHSPGRPRYASSSYVPSPSPPASSSGHRPIAGKIADMHEYSYVRVYTWFYMTFSGALYLYTLYLHRVSVDE